MTMLGDTRSGFTEFPARILPPHRRFSSFRPGRSLLFASKMSTSAEILAFGLFRRYMRNVVIPNMLAGVLETDQEQTELIAAQWAEMSETQKLLWSNKGEQEKNKLSQHITSAGATPFRVC